MIRNITDVKGIKCWGAHIGIKSQKRDLAIMYSQVPANVAATFTRNVVISECIKVNREHLKSKKAQVIVVNSGNANTCTGEQGREGAEQMAEAAAKALKVKKEHVLIGSTGIIGREFPTRKVVEGIERNAGRITSRKLAGSLTASAILTTDTFSKEGFVSFSLRHKKINMAGIAKGSGMIHPNMGTMMAYIFSDAAIRQDLLEKALRQAVDKSFNMISVDGDTSTNDMAVVMCNGMAKNVEIGDENSNAFKVFTSKLEKLCVHLAKLIVSDGEGATKTIEYKVINAADEDSAKKVVRTISNSSLVKTAIYGRDPNWGRIIAAAGRAGVEFDPDQIDLFIGTKDVIQLLDKGRPVYQSFTKLKMRMKASFIRVTLNLNMGKARATGWGTDLSEEYVRFNSMYTT